MSDDLVVLWRRCDPTGDTCCEIVQLAEGFFELRLLDGGQLTRRDGTTDLTALLERAEHLVIPTPPPPRHPARAGAA